MKVITEQQLTSLIDDIIHEREKSAKANSIPFRAVPFTDLSAEIKRRVGDDWAVRRANLVLTPDDMRAIATNRFYKKTGFRMLMLFVIVMLGIAMATITFRLIPQLAYLGILLGGSIIFVFLFAKKQRQSRKEFQQTLDSDGEGKP